MTPEAPTSLATAGGDWQTLSDTTAIGNTIHKEYVKLEYKTSAYTADLRNHVQ